MLSAFVVMLACYVLAVCSMFKAARRPCKEMERVERYLQNPAQFKGKGTLIWIDSIFCDPFEPGDMLDQTFLVRMDARTLAEFKNPRAAVCLARVLAEHFELPLNLEGAYA
jgi:hypothetical protein